MKVLPITLLVTTVLGSIGLAGCQTTEDDYYYGDYPQQRVVRTYEDDSVYVRRPNWGYVEDRPSRGYRPRDYDRPPRDVTPPAPRWTPRDEPRPTRWEQPRQPVVHAPPPQDTRGRRPPPPEDRRGHGGDNDPPPIIRINPR